MQSFADFVAAQAAPLLGLAHAMTANPHDAWDLTQETLARIGERWGRTQFDEPAAYARTVMVRLNIDRLRRLRRELPRATHVLTRADGSTYAFSDVTVSCEPPKTIAGDPMGEGRGRIWMYSPIEVSGSEDEDDVVVEKPFVYFEGRVDKLTEDTTFTLPINGPGASDTSPLTLFMADPEVAENAGRANEVSSAVAGGGTVRVLRASCDPTPVLELEVDATLGSEVQQGTLRIAGAYR